MTLTAEQIEVITQGVLQQLRARGVMAAPQTRGRAVSTAEAGVTLRERVVTEDTLAAAGVAGKTVILAPTTVITPSGHDYIRRHHITIASADDARSTSKAGGTLIVTEAASVAAAAAATAGWCQVSAKSDFDAATQARQQLPQPVICCCVEPSTTACLLNRDSSIRAAVVTEKTDPALLLPAMNPHILCINPLGCSFSVILGFMRQMSAGGTAPAAWKELS